MSTTPEIKTTEKLAIDGGTPAVKHAIAPMYPGGRRIDGREEDAVLGVLRSKRLFRYYGVNAGPSKVEELESRFASKMGVRHALAVASGTTALTSALAGLGVGPGDEVIVPAYTWISTAAAVIAVGAVPVIAEVDDSLTLDPADTENKLTDSTKVILPVHMRGAPSDMGAIKEIATKYGIRLLEDTAQADGGSFEGRMLGSIGDAGIFSLQFNKILTSGEGGVVTTSDPIVYERALMYHDVAASQRADIPVNSAMLGINCRMSELQGAVALVQLEKLDALLADMRRNKAAIKNAVSGAVERAGGKFRRLTDPAGDTAIALIFFMPTAEKAKLAASALAAEGVSTSVLFEPDHSDYHIYYHWTPVLHKRYWANEGPWDWHKGAIEYSQDMCPQSLELLGRAVHIDVSPDLTEENISEISAAINKVLRDRRFTA